MEKLFGRNIEAVPDVLAMIREFGKNRGLGRDDVSDACIIAEEIFTNQVRYHPESSREISVGIDIEDDELIICLTDFDVDAFDITGTPEVDTSLPLSRRKPGGLGIHFVRKIASEVTYDYRDRESRITIKKKVGSSRA